MTDTLLSMWKGSVTPSGGCGVRVSAVVRDAMIDFVAPRYGVSREQVLSLSRLRPIAHARQEVMWRLRRIPGPDGKPKHSYPAIAASVGLTDHTTAIHAVKAYERRTAA